MFGFRIRSFPRILLKSNFYAKGPASRPFRNVMELLEVELHPCGEFNITIGRISVI